MSNRGFLYHASALGVSGNINGKPIRPQAASVLPPAGGSGEAEWSNYQLDNFFTYDKVATRTVAIEESEIHRVVTDAAVTKFNLAGRVKADGIRAHLEAIHPVKEESDPQFSIRGTTFDGLTIDGHPVTLKPVWPRDPCVTADIRAQYSKIDAAQAPDERTARWPRDVVEALRRAFVWFRRPGRPPKPAAYNDFTVVPLFEIDEETRKRYEVEGNIIKIPGLGFIQLGQLIMRKDEWRVTMVQAYLESPRPRDNEPEAFDRGVGGGMVTCGSVASNGGHTEPPNAGT